MPTKRIAYTGINLIPPISIQAFIAVIKDIAELNELKNLLEKALVENKWVTLVYDSSKNLNFTQYMKRMKKCLTVKILNDTIFSINPMRE